VEEGGPVSTVSYEYDELDLADRAIEPEGSFLSTAFLLVNISSVSTIASSRLCCSAVVSATFWKKMVAPPNIPPQARRAAPEPMTEPTFARPQTLFGAVRGVAALHNRYSSRFPLTSGAQGTTNPTRMPSLF
jgi:hypothetical protein